MSDTYNGWTNRATWNVHLWLSNDEYHEKKISGMVDRRYGLDKLNPEETDEAVEEFADWLAAYCKDLWENGETPDGEPLDQCDFTELAEAWMEV